MENVLFITNNISPTSVGGREQLSRLLRDALSEVYGARFSSIELSKSRFGETSPFRERITGYIDGASPASISRITEIVRSQEVSHVVLNGSNLGRIAQAVRAKAPSVRISTFLHNCETRFFFGSLRQSPSLRALGVLVANLQAERMAVRHSDSLICLNQRDGEQLRRTYGRLCTHILPMALKDLLPKDVGSACQVLSGDYALFVGGTFYANRQGIDWFVEHVAAKSPLKTVVVGKGFEAWKRLLERNGNVEVVGSVDSLVPWYLGAQVVIAPIFDGSGMKTKVAEALMFGKRVVGTPEAFVGYEAIVGRAGIVCESPAEFLAALAFEATRPFIAIDPELRAAYEERYSFEAARDQLAGILAE